MLRVIDRRFIGRPALNVGGFDLYQSRNYIDLHHVSESFIYDCYTASEIVYEQGSRPLLETIVHRVAMCHPQPVERLAAIIRFVAVDVPWAGYYQKLFGHRLPADRNLSEEQIIASGFGWCNEQARLFCVLAQIAGLPSRLVFAGNPEKCYGHVVAEALTPSGWLAVDPSLNFMFLCDGQPVRASQVYRDPAMRNYFSQPYRDACHRLVDDVGQAAYAMAAAEDPLDGFSSLGYINHYPGRLSADRGDGSLGLSIIERRESPVKSLRQAWPTQQWKNHPTQASLIR